MSFVFFDRQCLEECDSLGLPPSEQGRLDLELKIEDTKENIRKAEVRPRWRNDSTLLPGGSASDYKSAADYRSVPFYDSLLKKVA